MDTTLDRMAPAKQPLRLLMAEMEMTLRPPGKGEDLNDWLKTTRYWFEKTWPSLFEEMGNVRAGLFEWLLTNNTALLEPVAALRNINSELEEGFGRFQNALENCETSFQESATPTSNEDRERLGSLSRRGLKLLTRFRLQNALIEQQMAQVVGQGK